MYFPTIKHKLQHLIQPVNTPAYPFCANFHGFPTNSDNDRPTESTFKTQIERLEIDVAEVVGKLHSQGIEPCQIAQLLGLPDVVIDKILRELS